MTFNPTESQVEIIKAIESCGASKDQAEDVAKTVQAELGRSLPDAAAFVLAKASSQAARRHTRAARRRSAARAGSYSWRIGRSAGSLRRRTRRARVGVSSREGRMRRSRIQFGPSMIVGFMGVY